MQVMYGKLQVIFGHFNLAGHVTKITIISLILKWNKFIKQVNTPEDLKGY